MARARPSRLPEQLMQRLKTVGPGHAPKAAEPVATSTDKRRGLLEFLFGSVFRPVNLVRIWVPAAAAVILLLVIMQPRESSSGSRAAKGRGATMVKADGVRIDEELLSSFDAVTALPSGEPVRYRFREWMDQVVLEDSANHVVIEKRVPRVEVVAVGYEIY